MNIRITAIVVIAFICGTAITLQHWEAIDRENNAFAKECNDRGGTAVFGIARQCIGSQVAEPTKGEK